MYFTKQAELRGGAGTKPLARTWGFIYKLGVLSVAVVVFDVPSAGGRYLELAGETQMPLSARTHTGVPLVARQNLREAIPDNAWNR